MKKSKIFTLSLVIFFIGYYPIKCIVSATPLYAAPSILLPVLRTILDTFKNELIKQGLEKALDGLIKRFNEYIKNHSDNNSPKPKLEKIDNNKVRLSNVTLLSKRDVTMLEDALKQKNIELTLDNSLIAIANASGRSAVNQKGNNNTNTTTNNHTSVTVAPGGAGSNPVNQSVPEKGTTLNFNINNGSQPIDIKTSNNENPLKLQPPSVPAKIISFTVSCTLPRNIAKLNVDIMINGKVYGTISVSEKCPKQKIPISLPETQEYNIQISGQVDRYQEDKKASDGSNQKSEEDIAETKQTLSIEDKSSFELKYRTCTDPLKFFLGSTLSHSASSNQ